MADELLTASRWSTQESFPPTPPGAAELARCFAEVAIDLGAVPWVEITVCLPSQTATLKLSRLPERSPDGSGPAEVPSQPRSDSGGSEMQTHPKLNQVLDYMSTHRADPLSLAFVADRVYISSSYLAHLFQQHLGTTFGRVLADLRIQRAQTILLERPWESITIVAAESGFSQLRNFERTFKRTLGCSPKEFRKRAGVRQ